MPSEKEEDAKAKLVRVSGIRLTSTVGVLATGYSTLDWIGRGKKKQKDLPRGLVHAGVADGGSHVVGS